MNRQQTWTPLLVGPSTFSYSTNYYTVQSTPQPFNKRTYLPIQYPHQQQKISLEEFNFIHMCFLIITVTLTDQFMNLHANQGQFSNLAPAIICTLVIAAGLDTLHSWRRLLKWPQSPVGPRVPQPPTSPQIPRTGQPKLPSLWGPPPPATWQSHHKPQLHSYSRSSFIDVDQKLQIEKVKKGALVMPPYKRQA